MKKYTGDVLYQKTYTDSSFNRHINYGGLDRYLVQNHHAAIVSHEDFNRAAVLWQRSKEKGNDRNVVIDEKETAVVQKFFNYCISGLALMAAAEEVGLKFYHGSAGRILRNVKYLGDDY